MQDIILFKQFPKDIKIVINQYFLSDLDHQKNKLIQEKYLMKNCIDFINLYLQLNEIDMDLRFKFLLPIIFDFMPFDDNNTHQERQIRANSCNRWLLNQFKEK